MTDRNSTHSTLRERVVEHIFVGEALRTLWRHGVVDTEVLRSEFDAHGYDLVMARGRIVRHIQFKTGTARKPADVSVPMALAGKPCGCVIWIRVTAGLDMGPFLWFGGAPGESLPTIADYPPPLRATHNKEGERPPRPNHRLVPGSKFEELATIEDVLVRLFGEFRYDVTTCAPADLSQSEFGTCVTLVRDGGALEVDCEARLRRAAHLAIARRADAIVAVGAIKEVRPDYAKKVSGRSKMEFPSETPELGYVAVDKDHRGRHLSDRIVAQLLSATAGSVFATTDDQFMKRALKKAGFAERGQSWDRQRGALSLWWKD